MRTALLSLAVIFAVMAAGLIWGWDFWVFDDRGWRQHAHGWFALGAACFAAAFHPLVNRLDQY